MLKVVKENEGLLNMDFKFKLFLDKLLVFLNNNKIYIVLFSIVLFII